MAIDDQEDYIVFKQMKDQLLVQLNKDNGKLVQSFVDYIKSVIKSKESDGMQKFNSLLLLNEMLKSKNKLLINYVAKKILPRFYLLIQSPLKGKVLQ